MYKEMKTSEMYAALCDNASNWADAFMEIMENEKPTRGIMLTWFANAIEVSWDYRKKKEGV